MKFKYIFCSFLILIMSFMVYNMNLYLQIFSKVSNQNISNKKCKKINHKYSFEDMFLLNDEYIILSKHLLNLFNYEYLEKPSVNGGIYAYNIKQEKISYLPIKNYPKNIIFGPHGIDIVNKEYLFIINHSSKFNNGQERIEIVKILSNANEEIELSYIKSIILPKEFFGTLNAIVGIDLNTFYFTTWKPFGYTISNYDKNSIKEILLFKLKKFINNYSPVFNIKLTYVYMYHNGEIKKLENSKSISNNGLSYDSKRKILYSVQTYEKKINIYQLNNDGTKANFIRYINTIYSIDNIYYDEKVNKLYGGICGRMIDTENIVIALDKGSKIDNIEHFSGFEEINLNNDKVENIILQNDFKVVSSAIKFKKKFYFFTSNFIPGIYICEEK